MSSNPAELVVGTAGDLGRSFKVTSALPSVVLVLYLAALASTGGFSGEPDVSAIIESSHDLDVGDLAILGGLSLVVGLLIHPLQFPLTQLLEGYWGTNPVSESLMRVRQRSHLDRRRRTILREGSAQAEAVALRESCASAHERAAASMRAWNSARERAAYPEQPERVMPTRLGNVLRRYEDLAGTQYGLDAITIAPHLALLASAVHLDYLDDRRNQLDSAVRYVVVWFIATFATALCFWPHGFWLTLALGPYACVVLTYRGAISAAHSYGVALSTIIDLNRHELYRAFNLKPPRDSQEEREIVGPSVTKTIRWHKLTVPYDPMSDADLER